MDGINKLLDLQANDIDGLAGAENNVKGLFFDLLSCLGGDKHPMLPQGYKQKPMTGFLDILEAFNDMAKLQSTGSGIVCEVDSNEFDQNGNLVSGSDQTLDSKISKESTITNTDSDIDVHEFVDALNDALPLSPECKKGKKKQPSKKNSKAASSSDDEHLWTSASGSEYEDAN